MTPQPVLVPAFMPSGYEWIIILVIMLLLFGHKLPSMMRGLGGSIKEFKKGMHEADPSEELRKPLPPSAPEGAVARDASPADTPPAAPKA
jgi:sec-independent protein translocase protein TatA